MEELKHIYTIWKTFFRLCRSFIYRFLALLFGGRGLEVRVVRTDLPSPWLLRFGSGQALSQKRERKIIYAV
jgi:hypothetical protein